MKGPSERTSSQKLRSSIERCCRSNKNKFEHNEDLKSYNSGHP